MNVASYKTQNSNKNLVLNAVPINFSDKSIIEIWQQPFSDRDHLRNLRDELIHTHLVKRHGNFIEAIPYDLNNNLLSTSSCLQKKTILLSERIDIAKALLKSWIIIRPLAKVVIFAYKVKNELPNPENSIPLGVQTRSRNPPATLSRTA